MSFEVIKIGAESMKDSASIKRACELFLNSKSWIMVVSAFYGMTNILEKVVNSRSKDPFFFEFLSFHKDIFLSLGLDFESFKETQVLRFNKAFERLQKTVKGSNEEQELFAEIISMGEDFSQMIVCMYMSQNLTELKFVKIINSRFVIATKPGDYIQADFDQSQTSKNIVTTFSDPNAKYVVQGYVAGYLGEDRSIKTTLLGREGGDVTAALICACLRNNGIDSSLTYVKIFGENPIPLEIVGIKKFFSKQKEIGVIIVSERIVLVEGLPEDFKIVDFDKSNNTLYVTSTKVIVDELKREILRETLVAE